MNSRRGSARSSRPTASTRRSRTARSSEGGVFPFETGIPGGLIRAAGITLVGVLPTHRRRGILRRLMRAQIDDIHERGEPMAYLWASEDALYGRFGYGIASFSGNVEIPRDRAAFHDDFQLSGRSASSRTRPSSPSPRSSGRRPSAIRACSCARRTGGGIGDWPTRSGAARAAARWCGRCWSSTAGRRRMRSTGSTSRLRAGLRPASPA